MKARGVRAKDSRIDREYAPPLYRRGDELAKYLEGEAAMHAKLFKQLAKEKK